MLHSYFVARQSTRSEDSKFLISGRHTTFPVYMPLFNALLGPGWNVAQVRWTEALETSGWYF